MSKFDWKVLDRNYEDVIYETYNGIAKITINRPEVRNAFRPKTVMELIDAFTVAREDNEVGVIVLTGANHGKGEDKEAFCSGGDQSVRGHGGYVGEDNVPRLNVLDLQRLIRVIPKPVIAMVNGYAIGGGHVLHIVCDLTIASENAKFGQNWSSCRLLRRWLWRRLLGSYDRSQTRSRSMVLVPSIHSSSSI